MTSKSDKNLVADAQRQHKLYRIAESNVELRECLSMSGTTYDTDGYFLLEWCIRNGHEDLIYSTYGKKEIEHARENIAHQAKRTGIKLPDGLNSYSLRVDQKSNGSVVLVDESSGKDRPIMSIGFFSQMPELDAADRGQLAFEVISVAAKIMAAKQREELDAKS